MPVVSADEPTRYFYEASGKDEWWTGSEFHNLAPPFVEAFVETKRPKRMFDNDGDAVEPRDYLPKQWGALVRADDLKKSHEPVHGDWWAEAAREGVERFFVENLNKKRGEYVLDPACRPRWLVSLSVYWIRDARYEGVPVGQRGKVQGPLGRVYLVVDEHGKLGTFKDGSRARLALADVNRAQSAQDRADLTATIGYLTNPLLFAISLMHAKKVEVRGVMADTSRAARRRAEKGHENRVPETAEAGEVHYYEIHFEPMRRVIQQVGRARELGLKRALELVPGFWRYYYPERPMFGKSYSGWVWISPHSRGDEKYGEIKKDYKIKKPAERPRWVQPPEPPPKVDTPRPELPPPGQPPQRQPQERVNSDGARSSSSMGPLHSLLGRLRRRRKRR